MDLKYYFYSQFYWYYNNISQKNILNCLVLLLCSYPVYMLASGLVPKHPEGFWKRSGRSFAFGLLLAYVYLVFHFTVFVRSTYAEPHYTLELFWSYKLARQGSKGILVEIILNCIMLIPEGLLLPMVLPCRKRAAKFWVTALLGLLTTCMIESLQLVLRRGLFEFDDIINNFIGILAGYLLYAILAGIGEFFLFVRGKPSKRLAE